MDIQGDFYMGNEAREAEFHNLFGKLTARQQDSVLSMEREFTWAAQLHPDNAPLPPDAPPRGSVRTASDTGI
ncbi:MAG: hypothetical protein LBG76_00080 [Treponema sp.]|jgi:hypothetical protein|nr:hypothetical protein [Treponema sp.]